MDIFIGLIIFLVVVAFGLKYRYPIFQWMNFNITEKGTKKYREKELRRKIEDAQEELNSLEDEQQ